MWDWNGTSWWWFVMLGGMLLVWGLIAWIVVQLVRSDRDAAFGPPAADPQAILAARYARGEIDANEYRERLGVLRDESATTPPDSTRSSLMGS